MDDQTQNPTPINDETEMSEEVTAVEEGDETKTSEETNVEEDASAEARARVLSFINELEAELSKNVEKNAEALATILKLKKHVYVSGASLKLIVETLGLVL